MADVDPLERLRIELPRLLREHPEVRHELWGLMLEAFPSRQEFMDLLQEVRASREESNRRFEELRADLDRRFSDLRSDMDRRFQAVIAELQSQRIHLNALGGRVGFGLEYLVKGVVEEFAGQSFPSAERLRLADKDGEVFGVSGVEIEFDLYVHNGAAYVVEIKSHVKSSDILQFYRKAVFAEARLGRPLTRLLVALSIEPGLEDLLQRLNIHHRIRAVMG